MPHINAYHPNNLVVLKLDQVQTCLEALKRQLVTDEISYDPSTLLPPPLVPCMREMAELIMMIGIVSERTGRMSEALRVQQTQSITRPLMLGM